MVELRIDLSPHIKRLDNLTQKPWLTSWMVGAYESLFRGGGQEFEGYQNYSTGQDARFIDWKVSARADKLLTRVFVEERDVKVYVVMDVSNNMLYSSNDKLKCEYAAELTNSLLFAVSANGDQPGLYMCSADVDVALMARSDQAQYYSIVNNLSNAKNYGGKPNLSAAFDHLFHSKERGVIFVVSDFLRTDDNTIEQLNLLRSKFDIFVLIIRDRFEHALPEHLNAVAIENMDSSDSIIVDIRNVKDEYEQEMIKNEKHLRNLFLTHDIGNAIMYTDEPFEVRLHDFFSSGGGRWK